MQEGGFACPRWPTDRATLSGPYLEINAMQDLQRLPALQLVVFMQITNFEERWVHVRLRLAAGSVRAATQAGKRAASTLSASPAAATPRNTVGSYFTGREEK